MKEFKEFISRGNVMDMAVGIIIGGAFTAIVTSLVNDVVMPAIGILLAGVNFKDLKWVITPASGDIPEAAIYYGSFIQNQYRKSDQQNAQKRGRGTSCASQAQR